MKREGIGYVGMQGVSTGKRNGVVREFEAGGNTVLLAGTGTLNRGITINGANHIVILNTEWSPETTVEDQYHRAIFSLLGEGYHAAARPRQRKVRHLGPEFLDESPADDVCAPDEELMRSQAHARLSDEAQESVVLPAPPTLCVVVSVVDPSAW